MFNSIGLRCWSSCLRRIPQSAARAASLATANEAAPVTDRVCNPPAAGETLPLSTDVWRAYGNDAAVLDGALQTALVEAVHGLLELFGYTATPLITVTTSAPGGTNVTGADDFVGTGAAHTRNLG